MSALTLVKAGVHIVSALGVGKVLSDVVRNNTNVVTTADKVLVNAGSLVLGSMIVEKAATHVTETLDNFTRIGTQVKEELAEKTAEAREKREAEEAEQNKESTTEN